MVKNFSHISNVAWLTILDGLRRHALVGLIVLALACQVGGLLFFTFIPRDVGRAANDFVFSVGWLAGLLFIFFHAVNVSAWGEDRRVIHAILARPISRSEYVLGLFSGLAGLLFFLDLILSFLGWLVLHFINSKVDVYYFEFFSNNYYVLSWFSVFLVQLVLLAIVVLISALVRGSFTVLLLSLSYYFICNGLPVVRGSLLGPDAAFTNGYYTLLKWMAAIFPDFERLNYKIFVVTNSPLPPVGELLLNLGLMLLYVGLALAGACAAYSRRDLK